VRQTLKKKSINIFLKPHKSHKLRRNANGVPLMLLLNEYYICG